jgi:hypothetical protein
VAEFRAGLGWLLVCGILIGSASSVVAAPSDADDEAAGMVRSLQTELARPFRLPRELHLDPDLRAEAESIASAHLVRLKQLLPVWIEEERRLQTVKGVKPKGSEVYFAVFSRALNELALWQLEQGDAAYEKATLDVLKTSPAACQFSGDSRFNDFASRIMRIQAMPSGQRQAALAAERGLLEHWGKPRAAPQEWPNPLPQDAAMDAVGKIRAGGERPPLALPPVLASELLSKGMSYADLPGESKCRLEQWWLRVSLAQGKNPEAALSDFRYGTLIGAIDRYGKAFEAEAEAEQASNAAPSSAMRYPRMAARFDVTGVTTVSRRYDAAGKPIEAHVVKRKVEVRGIRGMRPVAFENTFDALTVRYALQGVAAKPGEPSSPLFQWVWSLEPSTGDKP